MEEKKVYERPSLDEFTPPAYDEWKASAVESLKGADFDKKLFTKTYEGVTLKPIYTKADFAANELYPGDYDFIRGAKAAGYMDEPWAVAEEATGCCAGSANLKLREYIKRGCTAVNVNIGRCGLNLTAKDDMKALFDGIDLASVRLHVRCGANAEEKLRLFLDNVPGASKARGCFGADPIGSFARNGRLSSDFTKLYDSMANAVKNAKKVAPALRTVLADGNVYANGGASAVEEAAFVLAAASEYMAAMTERGISADDAASSIRLSVSLGANFFMEISKLRAMRAMFARIAKAYGAGDDAAKADVFAKTSEFTMTAFDPYVNILRNTTEAFSGVVGGVDAMETLPLDSAIGQSDETTERIARNVQIMLREEFDLLRPVDPAGGSWYVETLTGELVKAISDKFKAIESEGGMSEYLKTGKAQSEIKATLADRFKKLASRQDRAVGTNMYVNMTEKLLVREPKPAKCACQSEPAVTCEKIEAHRWTEQFEALRMATDENAEKTGKRISVFLCNLGPIPQHKPRADFSRGFFEVGGFNVIGNDGFMTNGEAAKAAINSGADVAVICSKDDTYPEAVPMIAKAIKAEKPDMLVMLAGAPAPEFKGSYDEAGVDDYIHVRANCLEILRSIQTKRGIGK